MRVYREVQPSDSLGCLNRDVEAGERGRKYDMHDKRYETHHRALDTMVMPAVGIGEYTVLVLQASIASNRRVSDRGQRTVGVAKLCAEWSNNGYNNTLSATYAEHRGTEHDVQEALLAVRSSDFEDEDDDTLKGWINDKWKEFQVAFPGHLDGPDDKKGSTEKVRAHNYNANSPAYILSKPPSLTGVQRTIPEPPSISQEEGEAHRHGS